MGKTINLKGIEENDLQTQQNLGENRMQYNGKEKTEDFSLMYNDHGARNLCLQTGRWTGVDELAHKYWETSPFVSMGNNPIKFVDLDGRELIDKNGKKITYSVSEDGTVTWSKNANEDVKRVGNAMLYTETGKKMLDAMVNSKHKIFTKVEDKIEKSENGNYVRGRTVLKGAQKTKDGSYQVEVIGLLIFEGSIKKERSEQLDSEYHKSFKTINQAIAATASHEAFHATDEDNLKLIFQIKLEGKKPSYKEREEGAIQIQEQVARETKSKNDNNKENK
jgi:RHS repeat-associated protein